MKIHCFYEPWNGKDAPVVDLWKQIWSEQGWTPVVLSMKDAVRHRLFGDLCLRVQKYPSVNDWRFESLCYYRWCAYALHGGLCADYDVFPRESFPPRAFEGFVNGSPYIDPGFVAGTPAHIEQFLQRLLTFTPNSPHVSDAIIMKANSDLFTSTPAFTLCYRDPGWESHPLVHFANGKMDDYRVIPRVDQIRSVLKL